MSNNFGLTNEEQFKALQIIVRTRKVSLGILKSNFGSSARATNILSWLEADGFISMAAGSTSWEIDFNKIKEFLPKEKYVESYTSNVPIKENIRESKKPDEVIVWLVFFLGCLFLVPIIWGLCLLFTRIGGY